MKTSNDWQVFRSKYPYLNDDDIMDLRAMSEFKEFKKKDVLFNEERATNSVVFVAFGMIRGYVVDFAGDEKTIFITDENLFIARPHQLFLGTYSNYTLEAVIPSVVILMNQSKLMALGNVNPRISRMITESLFEIIQILVQRIESQICLSPENRYLDLLDNNPTLIQKAPNKYLANYLGFSPVSFSRIIKRITEVRSKN